MYIDEDIKDLTEEEYIEFMKRYDKFKKYNLPVHYYDIERQTNEYIYKEYVMHLDGEIKEDIMISNDLINPLANLAETGLYYPFNSRLSRDTVGHTHEHEFKDVLRELYDYPESFSLSEEDKEFYSKQELDFITMTQKYLLFIGLKDKLDSGLDRYVNELRDKYKDSDIYTLNNDHIEAILNNKVIVKNHYDDNYDRLTGTTFLVRDKFFDFKLFVRVIDYKVVKYSDVKHLYSSNNFKDDDSVRLYNLEILEKY